MTSLSLTSYQWVRSGHEPSAHWSEQVTCSRFCDLIGDLDFDRTSGPDPLSNHVSGWGLGTRLLFTPHLAVKHFTGWRQVISVLDYTRLLYAFPVRCI